MNTLRVLSLLRIGLIDIHTIKQYGTNCNLIHNNQFRPTVQKTPRYGTDKSDAVTKHMILGSFAMLSTFFYTHHIGTNLIQSRHPANMTTFEYNIDVRK